ncbi:preprotein translocase subunit SecG [Rickettsiella massiliensis]|uniref:preprotein translocase subunit SecG n=1 Tax=Rickettsiella massiliensis TaxID=676517 RepID=UPI00029A5CB5|nr:preprotein translocase subunit SecG [Rickettsiella massiliensis]
MLAQILFIFHVLVSVTLIGLILLQQGKGAEAGASFGSGASQTVFGGQGSGSFLFKLTAFFALIFFVTSLTLGYLAGHRIRQDDPIQKLDGLTQPTVLQKTSEVPHNTVKKQSNPMDSSAVNK